MATQSKAMTKGICNFCNAEIDKAKMTQHLKHCKEKAAAIAASMWKACNESGFWILQCGGECLL